MREERGQRERGERPKGERRYDIRDKRKERAEREEMGRVEI